MSGRKGRAFPKQCHDLLSERAERRPDHAAALQAHLADGTVTNDDALDGLHCVAADVTRTRLRTRADAKGLVEQQKKLLESVHKGSTKMAQGERGGSQAQPDARATSVSPKKGL